MASKRALWGAIAVIIVVIIVFASAYYLTLPKTTQTPTTTVANVITIGTTDSISSLDPAKADDYFSVLVIQNIFTPLLSYKPGTSVLQPELATNIPSTSDGTISPDGLTYTLYIRQNSKFSDGTPINASTVAYSMNRVIKLGLDPAYLLAPVANITVPSPYTLQIHLKYPDSAFLQVLALWVTAPVDPKYYTMSGPYTGMPITNGHYNVTYWKKGTEIILERNTNYYGTPALTQQINIMFYSDATSLKNAILTKAVDVGYKDVLPTDIPTLKNQSFLKITSSPGSVIRYISLNWKDPVIQNKHVRAAIEYALNRSYICNNVLYGTAIPLYSMMPTLPFNGYNVYVPSYANLYGYNQNLAKAKQELALAGYSSTNPLTLTLAYTPTHYGLIEQYVAMAIKNQIEAIGNVTVNLNPVETPAYWDDLMAGQFQMAMVGWYPDYWDPDDYMATFYDPAGTPTIGSFYNNSVMHNLTVQEELTINMSKRVQIFQEAQNISAQDIAFIPLYENNLMVYSLKTVSGIEFDPMLTFQLWVLQKTG